MKGITRIGYTIQVGAFQEVENAERLVLQLQGKGIDAFYFKKDGGFFAVRFGDFPTWDSARKAAAKLSSQKLIATYYIADPFGLEQKKNPGQRPKQVHPHIDKDNDMGLVAARTAERFIGIPYRWGGNNVSEGMDCSGFVRAVYNLCGVNIPRTSREQFQTGVSVSRSTLRDGDLVFFGESSRHVNHVGIYIGEGKFVHAPRTRQNIKISSLDENYYSRKFVGARRYF
jgi:cell wall-associated NlpC family hydrolase